MAITLVGHGIADATTVTIPAGHQNGDLIIIYAFRAATTAPTLPSGWTSLAVTSSGASSHQVGYKFAKSAAETSGTWTNASGLLCSVVRGAATNKQPSPTGGFGFAGGSVGTSSSLTTGLITIQQRDVYMIIFAAQKTTANNLSTGPPITGIVTQSNLNGAANEYAIYDSNNSYLQHNGSLPATTWSVGATSAEFRTYCAPIFPDTGYSSNYQGFDVGDGMSTGEKII